MERETTRMIQQFIFATLFAFASVLVWDHIGYELVVIGALTYIAAQATFPRAE